MEIRNAVAVKAIGFVLECVMENGEIYQYDMSFVKNSNGEMVQPLKEPDYFKKAFIELGAVVWPNDYGIHGNTITRDGVLISRAVS